MKNNRPTVRITVNRCFRGEEVEHKTEVQIPGGVCSAGSQGWRGSCDGGARSQG